VGASSVERDPSLASPVHEIVSHPRGIAAQQDVQFPDPIDRYLRQRVFAGRDLVTDAMSDRVARSERARQRLAALVAVRDHRRDAVPALIFSTAPLR
jgi:hypothetical protein